MGGPTNIHYANQLLDAAGTDRTVQALIAHFNRGVFLVARGFAQEELDKLANFIRCPVRDRWVQDEQPGVRPVQIDGSIPIPTLYISQGLHEAEIMHTRDFTKPAGRTVDLAYIIIAQGRSGALYNKVRIFYSLDAVRAGILEEALQGCSVVFSAVMLKKDVPRLSNAKLALVKVENLSGLSEMSETQGDSKIPICC